MDKGDIVDNVKNYYAQNCKSVQFKHRMKYFFLCYNILILNTLFVKLFNKRGKC